MGGIDAKKGAEVWSEIEDGSDIEITLHSTNVQIIPDPPTPDTPLEEIPLLKPATVDERLKALREAEKNKWEV